MSGQSLEAITPPLDQRALRASFALTLVTAVILAFTAFAEEPRTCNLSIKILGLETNEGNLMVALIDNAEAFDANGEPVRDARVAIERGEGLANLSTIPYGTYAVKVFHDENSNGKLDTNFVGYPKESFGFSRDAMGKFGPPSFEEAKFEVASPELAMTINMN